MTSAVVVGAGPNGLVAANLLADAGWDVLVLEAQAAPGGAVRHAEVAAAGYRHDLFSAFYPLAAVSPALAHLDLGAHGLVWRRAPAALAHVFPDGRAAVIGTDPADTAASVEAFGAGDGDAWLALLDEWQAVAGPLLDALLGPYPPIGATARLLARLRRPTAALRFIRTALLPVRRLAAERFAGPGAAMLLAGNTLHTDLTPESTLGGFYGLVLAMLAQTVGFPVPVGGSGSITDALIDRLHDRGATVRCRAEVTAVEIAGGRARGVQLADGERVRADVVVADVAAPLLYGRLVDARHLDDGFRRDLGRFEWDHGTVKINWALSAPIPWSDPGAAGAGTIHVGGDMDHLSAFASTLAAGRVPEDPFVLLGQMHTADPTRSPPGTETAWGYTHVPNTRARPDAAVWDAETTAALVSRVEAAVERRAPGFTALVVGRHVQTPDDLEAADANLVGGALNGGTAHLHQQLVFRPGAGGGGPATPVRGLFLASASAHPGGGVHGACGANAARAALRHRWRR